MSNIESEQDLSAEHPRDIQLDDDHDNFQCDFPPQASTTTTTPSAVAATLAFGAAGLLNNVPYVIMLASAKNINEGGVAAVYIANVLPSFAVKLTAPYWFDFVTYGTRLMVASLAMNLAFTVTAFFSQTATTTTSTSTSAVILVGQLSGVAMISFQCGLGEASLLGMAGKWDSRCQQQDFADDGNATLSRCRSRCLTAFSSGTGLAGPMGYLFKIALTEWLGWTISKTLVVAAVVLSISYAVVGRKLAAWSLAAEESSIIDFANEEGNERSSLFICGDDTDNEDQDSRAQELVAYRHRIIMEQPRFRTVERAFDASDDVGQVGVMCDVGDDDCSYCSLADLSDLTALQRFQLVQTMCWPYMIPLFTVYAAEYACQAGAWTAIGFPVTSASARSQFYEQANWLYQAGVFVSRSTGTLFTVNMTGLWIMPVVQVVNAIFFSVTAAAGTAHPHGFFHQKSVLLAISFFTGLLGGAVYVHGYNRIVADVPAKYTEFALSSTSLAESLGVVVADISGLFLQSCLYRSNGLKGALVQCPF